MAKRLAKFILFSLAGESYAMPLVEGAKFIEFESLSSLPDVDHRVAGVIYHEGKLITVLDTAKILEIKNSYSEKFNVLLFDFEGEPYGILIEKGLDTIKTPRVFTDCKKKKFKKYIKIPASRRRSSASRGGKQDKIYFLEPSELLKEIGLL